MKILFLAYEVESNLLLELSKLYKKEGHETHLMNCDTWTFEHNQNWYKDYNNFCHDYSNLEKEYKTLNSLGPETDVDYNYLYQVEEEYSICLNKIIRTDPILYIFSHERDYYNNPHISIKFKWIELIVRKVINLLDDFKPEYILTSNNNYFVKNLIFHLSLAKKIPVLNVASSRLQSKWIISDTFGLKTTDIYKKKMRTIGDFYIDESKQLIDEVMLTNKPSYSSHEKILSSINNRNLFLDFLKAFKETAKSLTLGIYTQKHYRGFFKPNYMSSVVSRSIWVEFRNLFRRGWIANRNIFVSDIPENLKYYYLTLHVIPESTILTLSTDDLNEMSIIEEISSKLPIDTFLVVKENIEMLGLRSPDYYYQLSKIHNVLLINPEYNSMMLIKESLGVISMCGTNLIEASIANKRAILIGNAEYSALSFVEKYNKFETQFYNYEYKLKSNNILQYIQTMNLLGDDIDLNYLLYAKYQISNLNYSDYLSEVVKLKALFDNFIVMKSSD